MLGRSLVLCALGFSVYASVAAASSARVRDRVLVVTRPDLLTSARRAIAAAAVALTAAAIVLWHALFTRDFANAYVAANTSSSTPPWYTFSAFWAGMDGSMLLWCVILSIYAAAFVRSPRSRRSDREPFVPWATPVLGLTLAFFTAVTAGPASPFRASELVPIDGRGLNPLLQSPGMVIHPPVLYAGFVGMLVPFALVVSALAVRRTGPEWIRVVRRWALVPWLALGAGMVLGGAWAYTELGWGGYWGWDPVENAAMLPWLAATAFLHSAAVQERRGMLKVWNVVLLLAAADLAVFGTFLTRSGLLSSVHAFTESPLGRWFFAFLSIQTVSGLAILAWRLPSLRTEHRLDSAFSRESGFLVNNLLFCGALVTILWGTLLPLLTEAFTGRQLAVGPPFFNRVVSPLAALLLLMAAVGPLLSWRRGTARTLLRRAARPALFAGATTLPAAATRNASFAVIVGLAAFAFWVGVLEIVSASRARGRILRIGTLRALPGMLRRNPRRYGGYLVHAGVAVMMFGFAGSLFRTQADVVVQPGDTFTFAGYAITYDGLERRSDQDKDVRMAVLDVRRGRRASAILRPQQNLHLNFDQPQSEIAIRTSPREDLYVILTGTRDDSDEASLRLYANPLVFWVWAGAALAVCGALVSLLAGVRRRDSVAEPAPSPSEVRVSSTS